jgi:RNA polymerase sigma-70 factor (ECF subfamily)
MTGLEAELAGALRAGRLRWPALAVPEELFRQAVLERLPPGAPAEAVRALHAADLFLVCACLTGQDAAAQAFDDAYLSQLRGSLMRIDAAPEFAAEALQLLRQKLLVAQPGVGPRIGGYNGRSPLLAWLRAAAVRTALNLKRDRRRAAAPLRALDEAEVLADSDPELAYIRGQHRAALKEALALGITTLSQRQRALLRLHVIEGLSIDRLAVIYGAHRATLARWIAQARAALLQEVARTLSQRQGISAEELAGFLGALGSRLDLSLSRLLRDSAPAGEAP